MAKEVVTIKKEELVKVIEYVRILEQSNAHLKTMVQEKILQDIENKINNS